MKIKSQFIDYYDCIQQYSSHPTNGLDADVKSGTADMLPWFRHQRVIEWPKRPDHMKREDKRKEERKFWTFPSFYGNIHDLTILIGFCGKVYPCAYLESLPDKRIWDDRRSRYMDSEDMPKKYAYCYNVDEVVEFFLEVKGRKFVESFNSRKYEDNYWSSRGRFNREGVEKWFAHFDTFDFEEFNEGEPLWMMRYEHKLPTKHTINPCLSDFQFYRVFDTNTAFQNIEMWRNANALDEMPMPEISDEMNVQRHGFNEESFRTPKGLKKQRRKENKERKRNRSN